MKHTSGSSTLSDADLDTHIEDLRSKLDGLTISLNLATAEKTRRLEYQTSQQQRKNPPLPSPAILSKSSPSFQLGSQVRIKNKYRGKKGKVGTIILLSSKTATVQIPNEGSFIKYYHNLELISNEE